jgi:exosortase/archaeosortase family protein
MSRFSVDGGGARIALVLVATTLAYPVTLESLWKQLGLDTPLAYLSLVPIVALVLAGARVLSNRSELAIHDRYLDFIIGVPLLVTALLIVVVLPVTLSTFFWTWRLDILSLPLFAAGAVALVFGVRALWRVRFALAFLFLAWPLPYGFVLDYTQSAFSTATLTVLHVVLKVWPVAYALGLGDGSLFFIPSHGAGFMVSVASACAGANGAIGFILVGLGAAAILNGPRISKLLWLFAGLILIWALDIARILVIFGAGRVAGEAFALDVLHPFIGLLFFDAGVVGMLVLAPRFGLHLRGAGAFRQRATALRARAAVASLRVKRAVPRARVAIALLVLAALAAGLANLRMQQFELLANDLGPPRLHSFTVAEASVAGWSVRKTDTIAWAARYFGSDASWDRYTYAGLQPTGPPTRAVAPHITLDVVSTSDLATFSAYGITACYQFHGYQIQTLKTVDLGAGVTAHTIAYRTDAGLQWTAVYWEWPVEGTHGQRYERMVLNVTTAAGNPTAVSPQQPDVLDRIRLAVADLLAPVPGTIDTRSASSARDFLVAFARDLIVSLANYDNGSVSRGA